jgi:hypothetical protein
MSCGTAAGTDPLREKLIADRGLLGQPGDG